MTTIVDFHNQFADVIDIENQLEIGTKIDLKLVSVDKRTEADSNVCNLANYGRAASCSFSKPTYHTEIVRQPEC